MRWRLKNKPFKPYLTGGLANGAMLLYLGSAYVLLNPNVSFLQVAKLTENGALSHFYILFNEKRGKCKLLAN
jgi:hypothetical protein